MTIAGISKIRYAQQVVLTPDAAGPMVNHKKVLRNEDFTQLCDTSISGFAENNRVLQNGCPLYETILRFRTQEDPSNWHNARGWLFRDRIGKDWLIGYGDEDDYPVVSWQQVNSKSETPDFQVTVQMKSRVGMLRVIRPIDGGYVDPTGTPPAGALQDSNGFFLYDKDGYYLMSNE